MRPVAVCTTLAASHWKCAPSNVPGAFEPRPLQLFGSGWPAVILQPPCCNRSSSAAPLSNSWLPTEVKSTPTRLSASTVGSSKNSADTSGDAPTRSPPATTTLSGLRDFSRATHAASASAPPTAGRCSAFAFSAKRPGDCRFPWKSLKAMILTVTGADATEGTCGVGAAQPASVAASSRLAARKGDIVIGRSWRGGGVIIRPLCGVAVTGS